MRDFDAWFQTFRDSIYTYDFFTDFKKVYENVDNIKVELNILNSLIGSKNIEDDFINIIMKYPETLKCIPILLAVRQNEIIINDNLGKHQIDFNLFNNIDTKLYIKFMKETGIFNLLSNSKIKSLQDYILGVEVGLDSNARKNRTGKTMESLIESYIQNTGYKYNETYFNQIGYADFNNKFSIDLSSYIKETVNKKFDFVINKGSKFFAIEVNFYNSKGSKLNETARSYKEIAIETKHIKNFSFVWIIDGKGWESSKKNLQDTFNSMEHIYNLNDVKNGLFKNLR